MELNYIMDKLFALINESSELDVNDIFLLERDSLCRVAQDGTVCTISCRVLPPNPELPQ